MQPNYHKSRYSNFHLVAKVVAMEATWEFWTQDIIFASSTASLQCGAPTENPFLSCFVLKIAFF